MITLNYTLNTYAGTSPSGTLVNSETSEYTWDWALDTGGDLESMTNLRYWGEVAGKNYYSELVINDYKVHGFNGDNFHIKFTTKVANKYTVKATEAITKNVTLSSIDLNTSLDKCDYICHNSERIPSSLKNGWKAPNPDDLKLSGLERGGSYGIKADNIDNSSKVRLFIEYDYYQR